MAPQPRDPTPDSATEHAATYIVALVFTDSGHLRTTLVVTPCLSSHRIMAASRAKTRKGQALRNRDSGRCLRKPTYRLESRRVGDPL
jgi:hypothetical protein